MAGLESQDLCLPALARTASLPRPASSQGTLKSGHPAPSTPDHTSQSCFLSLVWPQGFPFLLPGSRLLREALPILPAGPVGLDSLLPPLHSPVYYLPPTEP